MTGIGQASPRDVQDITWTKLLKPLADFHVEVPNCDGKYTPYALRVRSSRNPTKAPSCITRPALIRF